MPRELLTDKYRPKCLKELSFNQSVNSFLTSIAEKKDIIKKVDQTPSNKEASKKEAKINSLESKASTQKTKEAINQDVDKENKKEST